MLARELKRLARHSAIYGIGGLVSRLLAVILLPLYTHYLTPKDYGRVESVTAATAVLSILLQLGISNAFFRFYFDTKDAARRLVIVRTSFWFTMAMIRCVLDNWSCVDHGCTNSERTLTTTLTLLLRLASVAHTVV